MFIKKPFFSRFQRFEKKPLIRANEQIRAFEVQVIDEEGKNLGVMETAKAIDLAKKRELDLVEISSKTNPPICKIIDKGKYQYLQEKKEKKQRSKQKKGELKEIQIGFTTSEHDLKIKAQQLEKFLKAGSKVRISIKLKGRERSFGDLAKEKLEKFLSLIVVEYRREEEIKKNPSGMGLTICPGKPKNQ